jgi:hypothetical protein
MWFFIEVIDNKKLEKSDRADDDVDVLHIKRYAIKTYSALERWCSTWWCVHIVCQENYILESLVAHLYIVRDDAK